MAEETSIQSDVKALLHGSVDERLQVIERRTKERLCAILGTEEVPKKFEHISYEVTLKRFNRIGQEGMTSFGQEGLSMAFPESDFAEYKDEINDWKHEDEDDLYKPKRGRFKFV